MMAVTLTVLLGFAGLGTDVVFALSKQRQMQAVASAAAFSGAIAVKAGSIPTTEARGVAAKAGFVDGVNGVTVTVNRPPQGGSYIGVANAVEVVVSQPQNLPLVSLIQSGSWNISARAVAGPSGSGGGDGCILQLDPGTTGVSMSNGINLTMNECSLIVNATGNRALYVTGGATLNAKSVSVAGTAWKDNGGNWNLTDGMKILQPGGTDPYASTQVPSFSGCGGHGTLGSSYQVLGWQNPTLTPGVYCGLNMGNGGSVTMSPGVYIINGGSFRAQGGTSVTGTGVTIVLTGSGSDYATATIDNGVNFTMSAPTSGATAGLVLFQDPRAPHSGTNNLAGGSSVNITGAMYFPSQTVSYSNGTSSLAACTQLVAWNINFTGGANFKSGCGGAGVKPIGGSATISLIE